MESVSTATTASLDVEVEVTVDVGFSEDQLTEEFSKFFIESEIIDLVIDDNDDE